MSKFSVSSKKTNFKNVLLVFLFRYPISFVLVMCAVASVLVTVALRLTSLLVYDRPVVLHPVTVGRLRPKQIADSVNGRYVTLCTNIPMMTARRTGNHLFMLAVALYVAEQTNRTILMPRDGWPLDNWFDLDFIERYVETFPCPCWILRPWPRHCFHSDQRIDSERGLSQLRRSSHITLALCGNYQTYRFADLVNKSLRRVLRFRPEIQREADEFVSGSCPEEWTSGSYHRVGVHVRRGDFITEHWTALGTTVIDQGFIDKVVEYFVARHARVQFIIATDDFSWTKTAFAVKFTQDSNATSEISLSRPRDSIVGGRTSVSHQMAAVFSKGRSAGVDLAILTSCDAVVASTGSFGWWAAWLANKTTIYYSDWPKAGSKMSESFDAGLYWPQTWIPMR